MATLHRATPVLEVISICRNRASGATLRRIAELWPTQKTHTIMGPKFSVYSAADAKGGCEFVASKSAVLFIEFQNEFTTDGGKLHGGRCSQS
eukprot:811875-Prymnesium_polylepis.1